MPKKTSNKSKKSSNKSNKSSQKSHLENINKNAEEIEEIKETPEVIDETQEVIDETLEEDEILTKESEDKKIVENGEKKEEEKEEKKEEEKLNEEELEEETDINTDLNSKDENLNESTLPDASEAITDSEATEILENAEIPDNPQDPDSNGIQEINIESDKYADIDLDDDETFREMLKDFSDLDDGDLNMEELLEIQNAMEEVQEEDKGSGVNANTESTSGESQAIFDPYEGWGIYEQKDLYEGWGIYEDNTESQEKSFQPGEISEELEAKIQEELARKRKAKKLVTEEMFKKYCTDRRDKIWYFALWYLVFNVEDHQASKGALYEALKEDTSKSAIDPTPEHKFYFGLGFILRLKIMGQKIIDFKGDVLKLNVGADLLTDVLREVGPPISNRPVITEKEKKDMYIDFLTDDFNDI